MSQNIYHLNGPSGQHGGPVRPNPPPQGPQFQGHAPAALPKVSSPVGRKRIPTTQISNVREDLMSESDMREELSEYAIFRFEKLSDEGEVDDCGRPKRPSWEQARRTEDKSISKEEAARKIWQLKFTTRNLIDKKNTLSPPLKRQIDKTQEELAKEELESSKYIWTLVQIDHQLRAVEPYFVSSVTYQSPHRQRRKGHQHSKRFHANKGRHRHTQLKIGLERLSLTAYFQRVPRPGVDIQKLWKDKKKGSTGGAQGQPGQTNVTFQPNNTIQGHGHQPHQPQQQQQHGGRQPIPPPPHPHPVNQNRQNQHPQGQYPPGPQPRPFDKPVNHGAYNHGRQERHHSLNRRVNRGRRSGSSSDSEIDSRSSQSSTNTALSSVSDQRGHRKGHHQHHHHHHHHHQHRHSQPHGYKPVRVVNGSSLPCLSPSHPHHRVPRTPYPSSHESGSSVASHIERVREDAYRRGRIDARLNQELGYPKAGGRRPRPQVYQEHLPRRRMYRGSEEEEDDDDDDSLWRRFAHLDVYDRDRRVDGDVDYRHHRHHHHHTDARRRRREHEDRAQRDSVLDDDPFVLSDPSLSTYTYSTDGHGRVETHPETHPLSSSRVRRARIYY
ncbi:hypothetical protein F4808DRAFT_470188 [Astrocystis sublimbata]|nr:hypothetical protein F4808DRAFT_470188 [Astrocystis sublimbata]